MLATMESELQKRFKNWRPFETNNRIGDRLKLSTSLRTCFNNKLKNLERAS
jgi:hypothetical protein